MKRAVLWIRSQPHYRADAFRSGLQKLGYEIVERVNDPRPGDVLVSWNMYPSNEPVAHAWRKAGAKVLIAENGFIGKDKTGQQFYAVARDSHNGSGRWHVGGHDRWSALGIALSRKQQLGGVVVVRAQRGIGTKLMASPARWARDTVTGLQRTGYKAELRLHPGVDIKQERDDPDDKALARAGAVVLWASSFGVKAVVAGVPVVFAAPYWILSDVGLRLPEAVDGRIHLPNLVPLDDDRRLAALRRLAWAQFTTEELADGWPFEKLLDDACLNAGNLSLLNSALPRQPSRA